MSDVTIEEAKAVLRAAAHRRRRQLHQTLRLDAAEAAARHFLAEVPLGKADVVAGYWPIRDELDVRTVLARLMDRGQPVCLPIVLGDDRPLELRLWEQGTPLYEAGFGTLAPSELAPQVEPDVILMPLVGFDKHGTRLGYGGGYYDRTLERLSKRPRLVGLAFAVQELDAIPREPHDIPLDIIVTEQGARSFEHAAA